MKSIKSSQTNSKVTFKNRCNISLIYLGDLNEISSFGTRQLTEIFASLGKNSCELHIPSENIWPEVFLELAKKHGVRLVGYSTAASEDEYYSLFRKLPKQFDEVVYTGCDPDRRNVIILQEVSAAVVILDDRIRVTTFTDKLPKTLKVIGMPTEATSSHQVMYLDRLLAKTNTQMFFDHSPKLIIDRIVKGLRPN